MVTIRRETRERIIMKKNVDLNDDKDYVIENTNNEISFTNFKGVYEFLTSVYKYTAQCMAEDDYYGWTKGLDMIYLYTRPWWLNDEDVKEYDKSIIEVYNKLFSLNNTSNGNHRNKMNQLLFKKLRGIHLMVTINTKHLMLKDSSSDNDENYFEED